MNDTPNRWTRRKEEAQGKMLASIREARQTFYRDFPDGCRVKFDRPPSTPKNPSIRTGTGKILSKFSTHDGRFNYVRYTLEPEPDHPEDTDYRRKVHQCLFQTFLKDNPVRIKEEE